MINKFKNKDKIAFFKTFFHVIIENNAFGKMPIGSWLLRNMSLKY